MFYGSYLIRAATGLSPCELSLGHSCDVPVRIHSRMPVTSGHYKHYHYSNQDSSSLSYLSIPLLDFFGMAHHNDEPTDLNESAANIELGDTDNVNKPLMDGFTDDEPFIKSAQMKVLGRRRPSIIVKVITALALLALVIVLCIQSWVYFTAPKHPIVLRKSTATLLHPTCASSMRCN